MKERRSRLGCIASLLGLVLVALVAGCGGESQPRIVGKWQFSVSPDILDVLPDGTYSIYYKGNLQASGAWSLSDSTHLVITEADGDPHTYTLTWSGDDTVTVRDENGREVNTLSRVK